MLFYETIDATTLELLKKLQSNKVEEDPMPRMLHKSDWGNVKTKIMGEIKKSKLNLRTFTRMESRSEYSNRGRQRTKNKKQTTDNR